MTIIDDDDDDTFVNIVINIQEGSVPDPQERHVLVANKSRNLDADKKPIEVTFTDTPQIPRKPKKVQPVETNGTGQQNGQPTADADAVVEVEPKSLKRSHPDDVEQPLKKVKIAESSAEVVVVEDAGGAIVIDD